MRPKKPLVEGSSDYDAALCLSVSQVAVRPTTNDAEFAMLAGFETDDDAYFFALFKLICFVFHSFLLQIKFSFHATNLKTDSIHFRLCLYIHQSGGSFKLDLLFLFLQHFEFVNWFVFFQQFRIKLKK